MYVCPNFGLAYLKIGDSCDFEIFLWVLWDAYLFIFFNIARFKRIKGMKRLRLMYRLFVGYGKMESILINAIIFSQICRTKTVSKIISVTFINNFVKNFINGVTLGQN